MKAPQTVNGRSGPDPAETSDESLNSDRVKALQDFEDLKLELWEERGYARLTLDRPETRNAMRLTTLEEYIEALDYCESRRDVRCLILTGAGDRVLSSGGDLKDELKFTEQPEKLEAFVRRGAEFIARLLGSRLPVIAAVNGPVYGAMVSMVAACDLAISVEKAVFAVPTVSLGGIPGWGCTQLLTRTLGLRAAKRLVLGNQVLDSAEALRIGLVDELCPPDQLKPRAEALAEQLAFYPPTILAAIKKTMIEGLDRTLHQALELESRTLLQHNRSGNFREGIAAFLEKRPARFDYA